MKLIHHIQPGLTHQSIFQPGEQDIHWLGLEILRLKPGESWESIYPQEETALVILSGTCAVEAAGQNWLKLGARENTFNGIPTLAYIPRKTLFLVRAESWTEIAIIKSPCSVDLPPSLVLPEQVKVVEPGVENWQRKVHLLIPPGSPISQRLIVGETINPPGNWSGIPPHKHDRIGEDENILEEFYFFKTQPEDGYGIHLIYPYPSGQEQAFVVHNDDVALMLNGLHPTVAPPGVTLSYLWALAGEDKAYKIAFDPRFSWVSTHEQKIRNQS